MSQKSDQIINSDFLLLPHELLDGKVTNVVDVNIFGIIVDMDKSSAAEIMKTS